jgi:hypothetical protein
MDPAATNPQTGPKTPEGKAAAAQNAFTHGGTAQKLIVAGENFADFEALLAGLHAEYAPATETAVALVEDFAFAQWFLWRRIRSQNSVEHALYAAEPDPALWPDSAHHRLALAERYKTTAERSFQRALRNLEHLQYARLNTTARDQRQHNFQTRLALDHERLALQKERLALTKAREARIKAEDDDLAYEAACGNDKVPTVVQNIQVRQGVNGTVTEYDPPNDIIRLALTRGQFPPDQVCRKYLFVHGIPEEYWWDDECAARAHTRNHRLQQRLTRDLWFHMADQEDHNHGHAVSGFDDDE